VPRRRFDEATGRLGRALTTSVRHKRARLSGLRLTPATLSRRMNEARTLADRDLGRARAAFFAIVRERRTRLSRTAARLTPAPIERRHRLQSEALAVLFRRGEQAMTVRLDRLRARLTQAERLLATLRLSEQAILDRGYALVLDSSGTLVKRATEVKPGEALELRFADGPAHALATEAAAAGQKAGAKPAARPKAGGTKDAGKQGSLF
jgi:exodeoxyribonuclease VII large subunit